MIDRDHKLPLARQAKAVGISRGSIYYRPRPVGEAGLGLMRRIDELHLEYPFAGSRMMRGLLRQEGLSSGRRHIATLMRRSQFTSGAFTGLLKANGIQISMDGKGSWKDNVFVERLWKSVKYEEVYLRAYESVPEARTGLGRYFEFYNAGRPHSSLGGMTPDQFFDRAPAESAAA